MSEGVVGMRHLVGFLIGIALVGAACNKSKPTVTGRLSGPTDLAEFDGCAQNSASCVASDHLLLIANSFTNDLRIFDVEVGNFFKAPEPLFPLSIPVGELPVSLAIDPHGEFAFVVNAVSQNVSLVSLVDLVEVDAQPGVSRVDLRPDINTDVQPEFTVVPRQMAGASEADPWPKQTPLPVYVSLLGSGQIAVLNFQYPDSNAGTPQRLDLQTETIPVGGMPSGLAITKDGSTLFVADEGLPTIYKIDTATKTIANSIDVGAPSRRLALTSDESKLYVVHTTSTLIINPITGDLSVGSEISVVDTTSGSLLTTIQIPDMARSITFVDGIPLSVEGKNYSPQGTEVTHFAWVSNLDGTVYAVDAENNYPVYDNSTGGIIRFAPAAPGGLAGELISNNFKNTSIPNAKDDFRIFLLYEGSNALMEFFPADPSSTNYLLYQ